MYEQMCLHVFVSVFAYRSILYYVFHTQCYIAALASPFNSLFIENQRVDCLQ